MMLTDLGYAPKIKPEGMRGSHLYGRLWSISEDVVSLTALRIGRDEENLRKARTASGQITFSVDKPQIHSTTNSVTAFRSTAVHDLHHTMAYDRLSSLVAPGALS